MRHEKVDVIFQAAVDVFAESGFHQAKMDDIAQAAHVAKGTIYYHFKSKEDLFVGLINEGMDKLLNMAKINVQNQKSVIEQLQALIYSQVDYFIQNGKLAKLLLTEAFGTKERQKQFTAKIREYLQLIEKVLRDGMEKGEFKIVHPQETANAIFGATSVSVLQKIYSSGNTSEEDLIAETPVLMESLRNLVFQSILA